MMEWEKLDLKLSNFSKSASIWAFGKPLICGHQRFSGYSAISRDIHLRISTGELRWSAQTEANDWQQLRCTLSAMVSFQYVDAFTIVQRGVAGCSGVSTARF